MSKKTLTIYFSGDRVERFEIAGWGEVDVMTSSEEYKFLLAENGQTIGTLVVPKINVEYYFIVTRETE